MEHDFKPGDVVMLKSGGPKMTIKGIGKYGPAPSEDNALCGWFDKAAYKELVFELSTLCKVGPEDGPVQIVVPACHPVTPVAPEDELIDIAPGR